MLVLIFLPVAWMKRISFTLVLDVGDPGVGIVGKNIALFITIRKQDNGVKMQKTITMLSAVVKNLDLRKRTIARVDTAGIVQNVGKQTVSTIECRLW